MMMPSVVEERVGPFYLGFRVFRKKNGPKTGIEKRKKEAHETVDALLLETTSS